jgi:uncharacterized protein (DUF1697 family)
MQVVAFLRAVNVGGKTLRTAALADALGLVNVAAAGTFVALQARSAAAVAAAIRKRLPFETEVIALPGSEILALLEGSPFARAQGDAQRFASFLAGEPGSVRLPVDRPEGSDWEVRVALVSGRCALCLRRPGGPRALYPNAVVEKVLGVPATTRGWATLEAVGKILREGRVSAPRRGARSA